MELSRYELKKNVHLIYLKHFKHFKVELRYFMDISFDYCQPQAKAKAKAMPGRLYIHTRNNNK